MRKIETVWHFLLQSALQEKKFKHTQQGLAELFGYSLSTINYSLKPLAAIGCVRKESKFFVLENFEKLLYFWASARRLEKDIIYKTFYKGAVSEIEGLALPKSIFAGYSAYKIKLGEPPADYAKVYFYIAEKQLNEAKTRFPKNKQTKEKEANVFFLKEDKTMARYGKTTTLPQTFVDIWNMKDWYSKDFLEALKKKMYGILPQHNN